MAAENYGDAPTDMSHSRVAIKDRLSVRRIPLVCYAPTPTVVRYYLLHKDYYYNITPAHSESRL